MIKITEINKNVIHYECDCGTKGVCTFKPVNDDSVIVFDVRCPNCFNTERVTVLQYSSEVSKTKLAADLRDIDLTWSPILNEELGE